MTRLDHAREDRAGEVRLAGPGTAEEQQAGAAPAHLLETVCVGAAHLQRLALPRRGRQVVLEGPLQKPPRHAASPNSTLEVRLGGAAPFDGEQRGLALAERGQLLSGGQPGRARGSDRAGWLR